MTPEKLQQHKDNFKDTDNLCNVGFTKRFYDGLENYLRVECPNELIDDALWVNPVLAVYSWKFRERKKKIKRIIVWSSIVLLFLVVQILLIYLQIQL